MRRRTLVLALIALALVLAGVIAYLIETDEERIERVVEACIDSAIGNDVAGVRRHLLEDATLQWRSGEEKMLPRLESLVGEAARRVEGVSLDRHSLEVEGDEARGTWSGVARLRRGAAVPYSRVLFAADLTFRRSHDVWLIRRVVIRRR